MRFKSVRAAVQALFSVLVQPGGDSIDSDTWEMRRCMVQILVVRFLRVLSCRGVEWLGFLRWMRVVWLALASWVLIWFSNLSR